MNNFRNYLIALLTGLLVLSFANQPSQGAGSSAASKAIEYDRCLDFYTVVGVNAPTGYPLGYESAWKSELNWCAKYKP